MIVDAEETHRLFDEFNLKYRYLFPESWVIKLYMLQFFRVKVIPNISKPQFFVLGLGEDENFYKTAVKYFTKNLSEEKDK